MKQEVLRPPPLAAPEVTTVTLWGFFPDLLLCLNQHVLTCALDQ